MKKVVFLFTLLSYSLSFGQDQSSIQGTIIDGELFNEPLLMATVSIKNTSLSTHTNFHGNFEFNDLTPGNYNVVVQFLGYETKEVSVRVGVAETTTVQAILNAKRLTLGSPSLVKIASK